MDHDLALMSQESLTDPLGLRGARRNLAFSMLLNERLAADSCLAPWANGDIMRQVGLCTTNSVAKPGIAGVCLAMGIAKVSTVDKLVKECGFAPGVSHEGGKDLQDNKLDTALKLVVRCDDPAMCELQHHAARLLLELGADCNHVVEFTPTSSHGRGFDRDTWGAETKYLMADAIVKASVDTIRCLIAHGGAKCLQLVWNKEDSYFDGGAEVVPGEKLSAMQWAQRRCVQEQRKAAVVPLLQPESLPE
eukprot:COSAG02_NODE_491_length_21224_cov_5.973680_8_plen_248_part_00